MSKRSKDTRTFTILRPAAYQALEVGSVEDYLEGHQRVLTKLERIVDLGELQIKAATGYSNENVPTGSPDVKKFTFDGLVFEVTTSVRTRTEYQTVLDQIGGFLEVMINDQRDKIRKDCVRTYDGEPFVRWDYLMRGILGYSSRRTSLEIAQKLEAPEITGLEQLVVPIELYKSFDIKKPGAGNLWAQIKSFCKETRTATIEPLEDAMEDRAAIPSMPDETLAYFEQVGEYLLGVRTIPSPQRQPGKVFSFLFEIPEPSKPKESTALPVITSPSNYLGILAAFKDRIEPSLKRWKSPHENIGELITFFYGIENDARVLEAFPLLHDYKMKREGELSPNADNMFISIQTVYDRLKTLQEDYKTNRTLRVHRVWPIAP